MRHLRDIVSALVWSASSKDGRIADATSLEMKPKEVLDRNRSQLGFNEVLRYGE